MATLMIHDLDDATMARLAARAAANRRTIEAEARVTLASVAADRAGWVEELRDLQQRQADAVGSLPDSLPGIRAARESE